MPSQSKSEKEQERCYYLVKRKFKAVSGDEYGISLHFSVLTQTALVEYPQAGSFGSWISRNVFAISTTISALMNNPMSMNSQNREYLEFQKQKSHHLEKKIQELKGFSLQELKNLQKLVHANILQCYGLTYSNFGSIVGLHTECPGLSMLTIHECHLKGIQVREGRHILWARDLAAAIEYLNFKKIFNWDVTPMNCFLFDNGKSVKLGPMNFSREALEMYIFAPYNALRHLVYQAEMTYGFAVTLYLILTTEPTEPFNYKERPIFGAIKTTTILGRVVQACGRSDPKKVPRMRDVLNFMFYHRPELTSFKVKGPVTL